MEWQSTQSETQFRSIYLFLFFFCSWLAHRARKRAPSTHRAEGAGRERQFAGD
jgi:hypothetical protein